MSFVRASAAGVFAFLIFFCVTNYSVADEVVLYVVENEGEGLPPTARYSLMMGDPTTGHRVPVNQVRSSVGADEYWLQPNSRGQIVLTNGLAEFGWATLESEGGGVRFLRVSQVEAVTVAPPEDELVIDEGEWVNLVLTPDTKAVIEMIPDAVLPSDLRYKYLPGHHPTDGYLFFSKKSQWGEIHVPVEIVVDGETVRMVPYEEDGIVAVEAAGGENLGTIPIEHAGVSTGTDISWVGSAGSRPLIPLGSEGNNPLTGARVSLVMDRRASYQRQLLESSWSRETEAELVLIQLVDGRWRLAHSETNRYIEVEAFLSSLIPNTRKFDFSEWEVQVSDAKVSVVNKSTKEVHSLGEAGASTGQALGSNEGLVFALDWEKGVGLKKDSSRGLQVDPAIFLNGAMAEDSVWEEVARIESGGDLLAVRLPGRAWDCCYVRYGGRLYPVRLNVNHDRFGGFRIDPNNGFLDLLLLKGEQPHKVESIPFGKIEGADEDIHFGAYPVLPVRFRDGVRISTEKLGDEAGGVSAGVRLDVDLKLIERDRSWLNEYRESVLADLSQGNPGTTPRLSRVNQLLRVWDPKGDQLEEFGKLFAAVWEKNEHFGDQDRTPGELTSAFQFREKVFDRAVELMRIARTEAEMIAHARTAFVTLLEMVVIAEYDDARLKRRPSHRLARVGQRLMPWLILLTVAAFGVEIFDPEISLTPMPGTNIHLTELTPWDDSWGPKLGGILVSSLLSAYLWAPDSNSKLVSRLRIEERLEELVGVLVSIGFENGNPSRALSRLIEGIVCEYVLTKEGAEE